MTKDTGGPAFPTDHFLAQHKDGHFVEQEHPGMTLRDWFAGMAIGGQELTPEEAYEFADAMLAERSKP